MADECLDEWNERTDFPVTVEFRDEDDVLVTPTAATYRIDDQKARVNIRDVTAISPLASSVEVWVDSDENRILNQRHKFEVKTLTVEFDYNTGVGSKHGTSQYRWKTINLYGVLDVPSASISPSASASPST